MSLRNFWLLNDDDNKGDLIAHFLFVDFLFHFPPNITPSIPPFATSKFKPQISCISCYLPISVVVSAVSARSCWHAPKPIQYVRHVSVWLIFQNSNLYENGLQLMHSGLCKTITFKALRVLGACDFWLASPGRGLNSCRFFGCIVCEENEITAKHLTVIG